MTEKSLPWAGDAVGDAGPYSDVDWSEIYDLAMGVFGSMPDAGLILGSDISDVSAFGLHVYENSPTGMSVLVAPGAALVDGKFYKNDSVVTLSIGANASGSTRIDAVVLRKDAAAQTVRLAVKQGSSSTAFPTMTQTSALYEIPIAQVTVANGAVAIGNANIRQLATPQNGANGVYVIAQNSSPSTRKLTGEVVAWNTSGSRVVTSVNQLRNPLVAGVIAGVMNGNGWGRVLVRGIGWVNVSGTVNVGDYLSSGLNGVAVADNSAGRAAFAMALTPSSAGNPVLAYVDAAVRAPYPRGQVMRQATYNTNSTTYAAIDAANLTLAHTPTRAPLQLELEALVSINLAGGQARFDWNIGGTREGTVALAGSTALHAVQVAGAGDFQHIHLKYIKDMSSAALGTSITIQPMWRVGNGGETATLSILQPIYFRVRELR